MTIYKKKQIRYTERKRLDENRPEYKGGSANGKASGTYRADGVFLAEPISNIIGGSLCFLVMIISIRKELR